MAGSVPVLNLPEKNVFFPLLVIFLLLYPIYGEI